MKAGNPYNDELRDWERVARKQMAFLSEKGYDENKLRPGQPELMGAALKNGILSAHIALKLNRQPESLIVFSEGDYMGRFYVYQFSFGFNGRHFQPELFHMRMQVRRAIMEGPVKMDTLPAFSAVFEKLEQLAKYSRQPAPRIFLPGNLGGLKL